jgi:hypothetical protein
VATQWTVSTTQQSDKRWILTNGEVITAPLLEETPSGRKVRVMDAPEINGYSRDIDEIIQKAVQHVAEEKGETVWFQVPSPSELMTGGMYYIDKSDQTVPSLHIFSETGEAGQFWWEFSHESLPLSAYILMDTRNASYTRNGRHRVTVQIVYPSEYDNRPWASQTNNSAGLNDQASHLGIAANTHYSNHPMKGYEFAGQHHPESDHGLVKLVLDTIRGIEALDVIEIPDTRDGNFGTLSLHLTNTNCGSAPIEPLVDYLDAGPAMEKAASHYAEMLTALRSSGMVIPAFNQNEFLSALTNNDATLVLTPLQQDGTFDHDHTVGVQLSTGTIVVSCNRDDDISHAWEEAKLVAALTGEEDALTAFAKGHGAVDASRKAKHISASRKA